MPVQPAMGALQMDINVGKRGRKWMKWEKVGRAKICKWPGMAE